MENKISSILYTSINNIKKFIIIYFFFLIFLINIFLINSNMSEYLVHILFSIACFSIMLLSISTAKFVKNVFFSLSGIAFFLIGLFNIIHMIPLDSINNLFYSKELKSSVYFSYPIVLELLYIIFSFRHIEMTEIDTIVKRRYIFINMVVFTIFLGIYNLNINDKYRVIAVYFIIIVLTIWAIFYILRYPILKKDEINYLSIYLIFLITSNLVFNFLNNTEYRDLGMFIANIFKLFAYGIFYFSMVEKLLNKPYKILFKDLYLRNNQLNYINEKILEKNNQLENFQKYIKDRENMFRSLFDNIPLPMIIVSNHNSRIIYSNKRFVNLLKLKGLKQVINKNIFDVVNIEDKNKIGDILKKGYNGSYEGVACINNIYLNLEIQIFTANEDEDEYILVFKDISEMKKLEIMKNKVEKKLLEERMRNDFLSNITHDLKTPINVIYSSVQLQKLLIENGNFKTIKKYNFINKENCTTLIRLANNLIDVSKISYDYLKPQIEKYNIVELIEDFSTSLVDYIKSYNINFTFDTCDEEIYVDCDKEFMERIILNLLSNSIKYTENGNIQIIIKIYYDKVNISIIDDGCGMEEEFINQAFERYSMESSLNNLSRGTGIGLYVVKSLVELQGGNIFIKSKINEGTIVCLEFERSITDE
ncbi:PAS domain S-box-containing protein [Clostridium cavendishii DSM 21758]|uniref:histidine kinase n=1 Tax=Clostridium cavendishii DSM 21758 TaxID=1121302 RepID=A0A1M6NRC8_9CLOT|nr:ATP-binding protein [Clostridium cavendishii]SHJ98287.1 PAS domain S-box-containing protein [Clostridium cavendishii DSM 21758]